MILNYNKKYFIFLSFTTILFLWSQLLTSQESQYNKGRVNIGFEAGIQFTGIDDPYMIISEGGIGYNLGPNIEYYLSEVIKVRVGLQFDNRAFKLHDLGQVVGDSGYVGYSSYFKVEEKYKVNYLTIPLSLIYIKGNEKFKFFLQGTIYYSLYLNSTQTGYADVFISGYDAPHFNFADYPELNTPGHHSYEPDIQKFNSSDIGINILFGGEYYINSNFGITLSPGFSYSFSNVWEDPLRQTTWSRLYKITAGIIYNIK